jgi:type I restriction enzyme S subunit
MKILWEYKIPLPPLPEQRRIAAILDRADALRRKRRESIVMLDEFLRATFLDMFGDPVTNPNRWRVSDLDSLILDGPQNGLYCPASDYGAGTPIVRIDSFYAGEITALEKLKRVSIKQQTLDKYCIREGDVLINRVNSRKFLGKCAVVPTLKESTVFESNMMRMTIDDTQLLTTYLIALMQHDYIRNQILTKAKDAVNQSSINQRDVRSLQICLPPLPLQQEYATAVQKKLVLRDKLTNSLGQLDAQFNALVQRAFKGEL